jgi:hypothetical protein
MSTFTGRNVNVMSTFTGRNVYVYGTRHPVNVDITERLWITFLRSPLFSKHPVNVDITEGKEKPLSRLTDNG